MGTMRKHFLQGKGSPPEDRGQGVGYWEKTVLNELGRVLSSDWVCEPHISRYIHKRLERFYPTPIPECLHPTMSSSQSLRACSALSHATDSQRFLVYRCIFYMTWTLDGKNVCLLISLFSFIKSEEIIYTHSWRSCVPTYCCTSSLLSRR